MEQPDKFAELARVAVRRQETSRSFAVGVPMVVVIENLSPSNSIREFSVTVSMPTYCHPSMKTRCETWVPADFPGLHRFRRTQEDFAGVHIRAGDTFEVFEFGLCLDRKERSRMFGCGESDALHDRILVDAVMNGASLTSEISLSQIFSLAEG